MHVCEVCGGPAAVLIQDTREVAPLKGADPDTGKEVWYERRVKEGPRHAFCAAHRRRPVRHPRRETEAAPA